MDKQAIRESILKTVSEELDAWLEEEPGIQDPFQYEHRLVQRTLRIGRSILEHSQGRLSVDRNKKKES